MPRWTAILPVKGLGSAKSRLADGPENPEALALAFVEDVLSALSDATLIDEVLVVTSDPRVASVARDRRATVVDDTGHDGINAAVAWAAAQRPQASAIVAVVSDLPAADSASIDAVLGVAGGHQVSFLPDAAGTGTTMWCTTYPRSIRTRFGPDSARAHADAGAVDLSQLADGVSAERLARVRRDVDIPADLEDAARLGLGRATRAVLAPT